MNKIELNDDQIKSILEGKHVQDCKRMDVQPTKKDVDKYLVEILCVDIGLDTKGNHSFSNHPSKTNKEGEYLTIEQQTDPSIYFTTVAWLDTGKYSCPYYSDAALYLGGLTIIGVCGREDLTLQVKRVWVARVDNEFMWFCELKLDNLTTAQD